MSLQYLKNIEKYNLSEPTAISKLTYEQIKDELIEEVKRVKPDIKLVESDDYMVLLEVCAYRETYLRNMMNIDIKKMLPHYSSGVDLDNFIFAFYGGEKRVDGEDDAAFFERAKLSLHSYASAGSKESYEYWTKSFNALIYDALASRVSPGVVQIVYATSGEIEHDELIKFVSDTKVRPLTDNLIIKKATNVEIELNATVIVFDSNALSEIENTLRVNFTNRFYIGEKVIFSKLIDLLHINGVYSVVTNIKDDIEITDEEIAVINLNLNLITKNT